MHKLGLILVAGAVAVSCESANAQGFWIGIPGFGVGVGAPAYEYSAYDYPYRTYGDAYWGETWGAGYSYGPAVVYDEPYAYGAPYAANAADSYAYEPAVTYGYTANYTYPAFRRARSYGYRNNGFVTADRYGYGTTADRYGYGTTVYPERMRYSRSYGYSNARSYGYSNDDSVDRFRTRRHFAYSSSLSTRHPQTSVHRYSRSVQFHGQKGAIQSRNFAMHNSRSIANRDGVRASREESFAQAPRHSAQRHVRASEKFNSPKQPLRRASQQSDNPGSKPMAAPASASRIEPKQPTTTGSGSQGVFEKQRKSAGSK
jgi:hypothetical protein